MTEDHDGPAVVLGSVYDLGKMCLGMSERSLSHMTIMTTLLK